MNEYHCITELDLCLLILILPDLLYIYSHLKKPDEKPGRLPDPGLAKIQPDLFFSRQEGRKNANNPADKQPCQYFPEELSH